MHCSIVLPASLSSSSWGVDLKLLDRLPERLGLENHLLNLLADTEPSPSTSSIIWIMRRKKAYDENDVWEALLYNQNYSTVDNEMGILEFRNFEMLFPSKYNSICIISVDKNPLHLLYQNSSRFKQELKQHHLNTAPMTFQSGCVRKSSKSIL